MSFSMNCSDDAIRLPHLSHCDLSLHHLDDDPPNRLSTYFHLPVFYFLGYKLVCDLHHVGDLPDDLDHDPDAMGDNLDDGVDSVGNVEDDNPDMGDKDNMMDNTNPIPNTSPMHSMGYTNMDYNTRNSNNTMDYTHTDYNSMELGSLL